jgi:hypothetical protein
MEFATMDFIFLEARIKKFIHNKENLDINSSQEETKEIEQNVFSINRPKIDISESKDWITGQKFTQLINDRDNGLRTQHPYQGPTRESNWLIKKVPGSKIGSLAIGGYLDEFIFVRNLLATGFTKYVCLNDEYGKYVKGNMYDKYADDKSKFPEGCFIHIPIQDMSITTDEIVDKETNKLLAMILNGEDIYLHCSGGHGRSGTFAAVILKKLFPELTIDEIFNYIQWAHDQRVSNYFGPRLYIGSMIEDPASFYMGLGQVPSPQVLKQRNQVRRLSGEKEIK